MLAIHIAHKCPVNAQPSGPMAGPMSTRATAEGARPTACRRSSWAWECISREHFRSHINSHRVGHDVRPAFSKGVLKRTAPRPHRRYGPVGSRRRGRFENEPIQHVSGRITSWARSTLQARQTGCSSAGFGEPHTSNTLHLISGKDTLFVQILHCSRHSRSENVT